MNEIAIRRGEESVIEGAWNIDTAYALLEPVEKKLFDIWRDFVFDRSENCSLSLITGDREVCFMNNSVE